MRGVRLDSVEFLLPPFDSLRSNLVLVSTPIVPVTNRACNLAAIYLCSSNPAGFAD